MNKMVVAMVLIMSGAALFAGCIDDGDDGEDVIITFNGKEYLVDDIFDDFTSVKVTASNDVEYEGVPLDELLEDAGVSDLSAKTYKITASDDFTKEVTYLDIEEGILVEEEVMTAFPDLPGRYRVKNVVSIEPIDGDTLTVNGRLYTWMQPFDIFDEAVITVNETTAYTGVKLSDLINGTSLADPQNHNYTVIADDGFQKEVTWDDMMRGILVDDEDQWTFFPHLEKKYNVKNVVEISVV
ncbi:MAG: hypothetical protein JXA22_07790 [Candidatus Thermoplasmatota archaeon]|nr:hypothetical protein [Candidatus Thermoplasmatota archaeon]